ncbi:cell division protein DamX [Enterobacter hormaechei]|jgi:DamX protein|uniref:Cell division protein DamX n=1 Tax=Enterobacter hormaechei subsp. steigerwaltii TaxID=299766 RepID=A0AAE4E7V6_9ENTR|nr:MULTISPECIES: cell division protein DamX [Enterobacter]AVE72477.1 cell division protein DamX [Enterobacter cloacae complex sp.]MBE3300242.1 cell division protein DamX [Enterobacter cloacae complex sp. P30U]CAE7349348.1 Cell division protein DamX [Enterobacter cloacae]VAL59151.1 sporulation domain-containing protein [Enterobacter kobei]AWV74297.1 cell division protein DamX [Enterobacter hormaechei subsp. xiangfangensis]
MDEFKPEDELKPDPSDRRTGRSRQSSERDNEPQINFDDVELDADDRRPSRSRNARNEREDEEYESEEELMDEQPVERRPRKRKKAVAAKPASRQYIMMGLGVLVLVLLIVGIGSALKAPSTNSTEQTASAEKSIDLSGNDASNQANGAQPAPGTTSAEQTAGNTSAGQDISLPPVSATPTQGQAPATPEGQQRVEVQGDLNNALMQPQNQEQVNTAVVNSTLPTEPATVAPVHGSNAQQQTATTETKPRQTQTAPRQERKQAVIEPKRETKPQTVAKAPETKAPAQTKPAVSQPVKAPTPAATTAPKATATTAAPAATTPAATTPAAPAAKTGAASGKTTGNVGSLQSASSSNYTLQLSSSSNYDNLNAWAKKSNLKNYVVYQTTRNGQPWYVLVSGIYASKDEAKRAVSTLPADVQAKNPWAKPIHQVQADLK